MAGLIGQMLDQFQVLEHIGQGGMASVYRALDTRRLQEVAIKVLAPTIGGDRRFIRRFRREAGLVVRLKHPNIVPVLAYGQAAGVIYLAMPLISGETLYDRMLKRRLTDAEASRWMSEVGAALEFAHSKGVIHRDIKPSNVMIGEDDRAMLADFGLARLVEGSNTLTGSMMMGTPAYVSPEQGRGAPLDARSDEYSLGVIMYQIATGRLPFEGESPMATVLMHIEEPVPRPRRFNPGLSPVVERVILKSLAKDPQDRFPTVADQVEAYQKAIAGKTVEGLERALEVSADDSLLLSRPGPIAAPVIVRRTGSSWAVWALLALLPVMVVTGMLLYPALTNAQSPGPATATTAGLTPPPVSTLGPLEATPTESRQATATPVALAACPGIRMIGFTPMAGGDTVSWKIDNDSDAEVKITGFSADFPEANTLTRILFGGNVLWDLETDGPPSDQGIRLRPGVATSILPGMVRELKLVFTFVDSNPGYLLSLSLGDECTFQTEW